MSGDQDMDALTTDASDAPGAARRRIAATPEPAEPVEEAPQFVGADAFSPKVIEAPADEPAPDETVTTNEPKRTLLPPGTTVTVVYRGSADVADLKGPDGKGEHDYRFRPGEPVEVPSEVAEELLTWPGEQFEIVEPKE